MKLLFLLFAFVFADGREEGGDDDDVPVRRVPQHQVPLPSPVAVPPVAVPPSQPPVIVPSSQPTVIQNNPPATTIVPTSPEPQSPNPPPVENPLPTSLPQKAPEPIPIPETLPEPKSESPKAEPEALPQVESNKEQSKPESNEQKPEHISLPALPIAIGVLATVMIAAFYYIYRKRMKEMANAPMKKPKIEIFTSADEVKVRMNVDADVTVEAMEEGIDGVSEQDVYSLYQPDNNKSFMF